MSDPGQPVLRDAGGRVVRKLRLSVTDRCNFRCLYCMPEDGVEWIPREEILTFEEIERVARIAVGLGVERVRLTGGEPLIRKEIESLVASLARINNLHSVSMTTNGYYLREKASDLKAAGLDGVNVSLDSLDPARFAQIARRAGLDQVLAGIGEARAVGLAVKLNVVLMRGQNDDEIEAFVRLARREALPVRFIEFMPLDGDGRWSSALVVPSTEVLERAQRIAGLRPIVGDPAEPACRHGFADGMGEIGVISSVTAPFCSRCDRVRLTADGHLRPCLFSLQEYDLKPLLRGRATDTDVAAFLVQAVGRKPAGHQIGQQEFTPPSRAMFSIGG